MTSEIKNLFLELNKKKIFYLVLGNFELDLNRDLDLFVAETDKIKFKESLSGLGWLERREKPIYPFRNYFFKRIGDNFFCLDVRFHLKFGFKKENLWEPIDLSIFVNDFDAQNLIRRPRGFSAVLISLVRAAVEKEELKEEHICRLKEKIDLLRNELSKKEIEKLAEIEAVINKKNITQLDLFFLIQEYLKKTEGEIGNKRNFGLGYKVVFIGSDGTGKTTLINKIAEKVSFKIAKLYLGDREWLFDNLKNIYKKRGKNRLYKLTSEFILYPFDLFFRIFKIRRFARFRLILIDRLPGFPFSGKNFLDLIYNLILPQIDLLILLEGEPEKIWVRKKEFPIGKIQQEVKKWEQVFFKVKARKKIRLNTTEKNVNECVDRILNEVFSDDKSINCLFKKIIV